METEQNGQLPTVKPDVSHAIRLWANQPVVYSAWVKNVAPQLGINVDSLLLGETLSVITHDDENAFGIGTYVGDTNVPDVKQSIDTRMDWEIGMPQLPKEIKERLVEVKQQMETMDWVGEKNFALVRATWKENMRDFTKQRISEQPKLQKALQYRNSLLEVCSPSSAAFIAYAKGVK